MSNILWLIIIVVGILYFAHLTGSKKSNNQRSILERIACSLWVKGRQQGSEVADAIRTDAVIKEEAMQQIDDAQKALDKEYEDGQVEIKTTLKELQEQTLPELRDQPGILEQKARKAKQNYEESVKRGRPIQMHRANAIMILEMKEQAFEDIAAVEADIDNLEAILETRQTTYISNKATLRRERAELLTAASISLGDLNNRLSHIRSLTEELKTKREAAKIRQEVRDSMNNSDAARSAHTAAAEAGYEAL